MVNKVLNAVTKHLGESFGNSYKYYIEDVKQNMTKPCFTVDSLETNSRSRNTVQYDRTIPLVVHYFNDKQETLKKDSYAIGEQLVETLEYLPFEGTFLRGENISYHMVDGVLQLFITYRFRTQKISAEITPMGDITSTNIKHT